VVRTQIQLIEQQSQALKTLAYARKISIAELIRQSINNWLLHENEEDSKQAKRERALSLIGKYESGLTDLSIAHDHYLEEGF